MNALELYCKVQNVVMGCKTEEQLEVAKNYVKAAEKYLPSDLCLECITMVTSKEKQLLCK